MPIPFEMYQWLYISDIERCPYPPMNGDMRYKKWHDDKDKKDLLTALDRYAHHITINQIAYYMSLGKPTNKYGI